MVASERCFPVRWGHLRPILAIVSTLLPLHPQLEITLFLPAHLSKVTSAELDRYHLEDTCRGRLRMPRYGREGRESLAGFEDIPGMMEEAVENVRENFPKLLEVIPSLPR